MRRRRGLTIAAPLVAAAACGDSPTPPNPARAMVGTYTIEATFPTLVPDVRQGATTTPSTASLTGTLTVGDSVDLSRDDPFYPDVRLTAAFCPERDRCEPARSYASFTTLFLPERHVTFGFAGTSGSLHFDGPFVGDSVAGTAWNQVGTSRYDGRFVARKRR